MKIQLRDTKRPVRRHIFTNFDDAYVFFSGPEFEKLNKRPVRVTSYWTNPGFKQQLENEILIPLLKHGGHEWFKGIARAEDLLELYTSPYTKLSNRELEELNNGEYLKSGGAVTIRRKAQRIWETFLEIIWSEGKYVQNQDLFLAWERHIASKADGYVCIPQTLDRWKRDKSKEGIISLRLFFRPEYAENEGRVFHTFEVKDFFTEYKDWVAAGRVWKLGVLRHLPGIPTIGYEKKPVCVIVLDVLKISDFTVPLP